MFRTLTLAAASVFALAAPMAATAGPDGCPPGLAKKDPACVAPGQAKKHIEDKRDVNIDVTVTETNDGIPAGYSRLKNPERFGLESGVYYHKGTDVVRVDPETNRVISALGVIAALAD